MTPRPWCIPWPIPPFSSAPASSSVTRRSNLRPRRWLDKKRCPIGQWVQKRFEKLQLHRKQSNGLNIWTCEVKGPRKTRRLHGYLLADSTQLLVQPIANNPYLKLIEESAAKPS